MHKTADKPGGFAYRLAFQYGIAFFNYGFCRQSRMLGQWYVSFFRRREILYLLPFAEFFEINESYAAF